MNDYDKLLTVSPVDLLNFLIDKCGAKISHGFGKFISIEIESVNNDIILYLVYKPFYFFKPKKITISSFIFEDGQLIDFTYGLFSCDRDNPYPSLNLLLSDSYIKYVDHKIEKILK